MSQAVRALEPKEMWNYFADLNEVPRPSKKEERVIKFIVDFGEKLGLEPYVDAVGNVIIKKPASKGMEDRVTIVMQSHLDMVHQKNADTKFDFDKEGIKMYIDGDWVKAEGTTLGADNGIGVASIMTILASDTIAHPPLEALFTIDEETGMTGALGLIGGLLDGKILLNLDTEDDDELTIGCAGGTDVVATGTYKTKTVPDTWVGFKISVTGLTGGHSGVEINLGRANANKLMNRILYQASEEYKARIAEIDGGSLRNAIPRESFATIAISSRKARAFKKFIKEQNALLKEENRTTDPNLKLEIEEVATPKTTVETRFQNNLIRTVYACPNGIHRMSPDIKDLVQTSNNLARVLVKDGKYSIQNLTRSSVDSEKLDHARSIKAVFELLGADVVLEGEYPGWEPKPDAEIIKVMTKLYQELFNEEPHVNAIHAGLECGILGTNYPGMEMISFGPNIRGPHSPDEKCQISSVQKYWKFLIATLENIPKK